MYQTMFKNVMIGIKAAADIVKPEPQQDGLGDFYQSMFDPEGYKAEQEKRAKREQVFNAAIVVASVASVAFEAVHIAKRNRNRS